MKTKVLILLILIVLISCDDRRLNFDRGIIPPLPVNFTEVNSSYNDYNSDLEITWAARIFTLIFSSDRNSSGNDFDLIGYRGQIRFDLIDGSFEMKAERRSFSLLDSVNSPASELGPYFTGDFEYYDWYFILKDTGLHRLFYTSDAEGNNDIYCHYYSLTGEDDFEPVDDPAPLDGINSSYNEGYLTIHYGEVTNRETVYFTCDRDGDYDIWKAVGEENSLIDESTEVTRVRIGELSSTSSDKCPYISGDMMVFASDRAGGYGGFDLWYSVWDGQQWSAPVNFGGQINTEYDEYRPVVVSTDEKYFLNDLMIFSSDRPGGKGGFDLYYVGIPRYK
jgi:hypothetical protein